MGNVTFAQKYENFMQKLADKVEDMWEEWEKDSTTVLDILKKHKTALVAIATPILAFLTVEWCLILWIINMG